MQPCAIMQVRVCQLARAHARSVGALARPHGRQLYWKMATDAGFAAADEKLNTVYVHLWTLGTCGPKQGISPQPNDQNQP